MLLFVLVRAAGAAEVDVGGAVDVAAGVHLAREGGVSPAATETWAGLREVEGDLRAKAGAVVLTLEIDATLSGDGVPLGLAPSTDLGRTVWISPEVATLAVVAKGATLAIGAAPGPFRVEGIDGWERAMVTRAGIAALVPDQVVGGTLTLGGDRGRVVAVGGSATDAALILATEGSALAAAWSPVVGLRGEFGGDAWSAGAGAFAHEGVAFEAGGRGELGPVEVSGEGVLGTAQSGVMAQVALFPDGLVAPAVRGEWIAGALGGALGVRVNPASWATVKVEAGYRDGAAYGAAEVAAFSPWPPEGR